MRTLAFLFMSNFSALVLSASLACADVPKVYHVIKVKIITTDKNYVTYALLVGELYDFDMIEEYKKDSKRFTERIKQLMHQRDSINLYSHILRVKEKDLILLPKDKESKVALKEIQDIALIEYLHSDNADGEVFTNVLSSDSTWVSWRVSHTEDFSIGDNCIFTIHHFNKPDDNSKTVVKHFTSTLRSHQEKSLGFSTPEIDRMKERLRKLRIIVLSYCGC